MGKKRVKNDLTFDLALGWEMKACDLKRDCYQNEHRSLKCLSSGE